MGLLNIKRFLGKQLITDKPTVTEKALRLFTGAKSVRIKRPGLMYSNEYNPDRLTIVLDEEGVIKDITFG